MFKSTLCSSISQSGPLRCSSSATPVSTQVFPTPGSSPNQISSQVPMADWTSSKTWCPWIWVSYMHDSSLPTKIASNLWLSASIGRMLWRPNRCTQRRELFRTKRQMSSWPLTTGNTHLIDDDLEKLVVLRINLILWFSYARTASTKSNPNSHSTSPLFSTPPPLLNFFLVVLRESPYETQLFHFTSISLAHRFSQLT